MAESSRTTHDPPLIDSASPETSSELAQIGTALLDWKLWLKAAIIVGAVLWIYRPILRGDWLIDDDFYIYANPLLSDPHRLWKAWFQPGGFIEYYPIEQSVQWAQWILWGGDTFGYHLTNVLLHAFSALLLWRVFTKFHLRWAWLGGLLFAVHPALVESVVWVSELKNTLSLPPFLIAICFFIEYENHGRKRDYLFALGSFLIAMLCKISMAPFPVVILLYAWWRRDRLDLKDLETSLPFLVVSLILIALTAWCGNIYSETHRMDLTFATGGLLFRIALIGQTLSSYLVTGFLPFGLLPIYPRWPLDHLSPVDFLPWPLFAAALYWFWVRRATWGRHMLLGVGFFLLNIAPFTGLVIITYMRFTWVMDHLLYLPVIGLIGVVVAGVELFAQRLSYREIPVLQALTAGVVALLAWSSHDYAKLFIDQKTLWTFTIAHNPRAFSAFNNLGSIMLKEKRTADALKLFDEALKLDPDYFEAHYNRGLSLDRLERPKEAQEEYRKAVLLSPKNMESRLILAESLESGGDTFGAIEQYQIALRNDPDMAEGHAKLASLLIKAGRYSEAADELSETIRLYPGAASTHNDLGNVLYMMTLTSEAMAEYREAARLNPNMAEAHNNLGGALEESGHLNEAIKEFQAAARIDPTNPSLLLHLAHALVKAGRKDEAMIDLETVLRYDPGNADAKAGLAILRGPVSTKSPKN